MKRELIERIHYPFDFFDPPSLEMVNNIKSIFCPVCGKTTEMEPYSDNRRESGVCQCCGSWNRQRLMAVFFMRIVERLTNVRVSSLASDEIPKNLQIYSAEWFGALHETLRRLPGYTWSRYSGRERRSGDIVDGHPHQNLLSTSFPDNKFDIVLTADVLEHIPNPYLAHREIYRILKRGGVHLFTVPSQMNNPLDDQRAAMANGEIIHLAPPQWHGTQEDSNLVYTVFGLEMISHLWGLGFHVQLQEVSLPEMGIVGPRAFVFQAQKHHAPILQDIPSGLRRMRET